MAVEFIAADPDTPYPLGRSVRNHDPRNRQYAALADIRPRAAVHVPGAQWWTRDVYDQGNEPSCTAQAAVGVARTTPFRAAFKPEWSGYNDPPERFTLYQAAQHVDPWPGVDYDGTSTDAPFKVLRDRGDITGWRWLFGIDEVLTWVRDFGPCAVGTDWHYAMFTPNAKGYIEPSGGIAGGHAYRLVQYSIPRDAFRIVNSWGRDWGDEGRAWITRTDLGSLLAAAGEAVTLEGG